MSCDLVLRDGLVVDGLGSEPRPADVAVDGDRIVAVGTVAAGRTLRGGSTPR
jgi:N-acyl-D-amino-acid deacylase